MTDANGIQFESASSRIADESNSSFTLDRSTVPMDVDDGDDDDELIASATIKLNGHVSPSRRSIENETNDIHEKEDSFRQG